VARREAEVTIRFPVLGVAPFVNDVVDTGDDDVVDCNVDGVRNNGFDDNDDCDSTELSGGKDDENV